MAREYGSRKSRRGNGLPQQVIVMVVTFALGYFTASIFDLETLSHWMTTQVLDNHEVKQAPVANRTQEQKPPKPKFEFYTLLANEKKANANGATPAAHAPTNQNTTNLSAVTSKSAASASTATVAVNKSIHATGSQSKVAAVIAAKPVAIAAPPPRSVNYVVQVAAFKTQRDAEHMKGLLTLKGFEVSVASISTQTQGTWYRVVIGPYPNRSLAQKAQGILAKTERLNGMVRSAGG